MTLKIAAAIFGAFLAGFIAGLIAQAHVYNALGG